MAVSKNPTPRPLAPLALSLALAALGTSSANVGLPALADAYSAPFHRVQWVVLAYLLAVTTMVVGAGRLGDLFGRRRLLLAGIGLFTLASLLCGLAPTLTLLIAARAVQGLGAAMMMALSLAFVANAVPKAKAGRAMGLLGTASAIGTALGPTLGGATIAAFGWPGLFLVNLPLGLAALVLAARNLPADRPRDASGQGFDPVGTLLLAASLAAYVFAMVPGRAGFGPLNLGLLATAAAGAALFLFVQARSAAPLVEPAMLRDPTVRAGLAMGALVMTVMMATLVVGPFHLAKALGLDAASVGLAMSAGPVAAALAGVPAGRLVDRFGARRTTVSGLVGMAMACALLALLPASGIAFYVGPLVLMTAGYALFQTANNMAVVAAAAPERRGVLSGMLNLSRNLGHVTGASLMGTLFALGSGSADIAAAAPEAVAQGMRFTFAAAAVPMFVALIIASVASTERSGRRLVSASGPTARAATAPR